VIVASPDKPLPNADPDSKPYWDAAKAHELRVQQCSGCGRFRWPPSGVCPDCHSWRFQWMKLPGTGTINSYVVVHQPIGAFASDVPYVLARIVLDGTGDHANVSSSVADCPWERIRVGMRVTVFFDDVTDSVTLPKFRPLE
jgi:uncharacterized OB-fold protein